MAAIEQMKAHFAAYGVQAVEVPEWGEEGKPLVIRFTPMTLAEKQRLAQIGEREGYILRLADCLVMKALDADGKKMFTIDDKHTLRNQVDPEVLARVVKQMMEAPSVQDMEKNSPRTPASG